MTAGQSDRASNVVLAYDGDAYANAKSEFVAEILLRARCGQ